MSIASRSIASRPVLPLLSFAAAALMILGICLVSMSLQPANRPAARLGAHDRAGRPGTQLVVNRTAAFDTLALVLPDRRDHQTVER